MCARVWVGWSHTTKRKLEIQLGHMDYKGTTTPHSQIHFVRKVLVDASAGLSCHSAKRIINFLFVQVAAGVPSGVSLHFPLSHYTLFALCFLRSLSLSLSLCISLPFVHSFVHLQYQPTFVHAIWASRSDTNRITRLPIFIGKHACTSHLTNVKYTDFHSIVRKKSLVIAGFVGKYFVNKPKSCWLIKFWSHTYWAGMRVSDVIGG